MLRSFEPPALPGPTLLSDQRVVFQPRAHSAMWAGIETLVAALRPTLGPCARAVLIERNTGRRFTPDIAHDGGTIARRVVALADPDAGVGAMLLRHALWRMHEQAGDGVATTAVLFHALVKHARPYLAAGGNAMRLREGILRGAAIAAEELDRQASPLDAHMSGDEALCAWARTQCDDAELADAIANAVATHGMDVTLRVEDGQRPGVALEFIPGALWNTGWHASPFTPDEQGERLMLRLPGAHVLVSDLDLSDAAYMEPLIMTLARLRPAHLLIVCRKVSPQLAALFVQARQRGIGDGVFVKTPTLSGPDRMAVLTDMALLTGATFIPYFEARNGSAPMIDLAGLLPASLGQADLAWASEHFVGIEGGHGSRDEQVAHLGRLDAALHTEERPERIRFYRDRIATFGSGVVRIKVGAHTEAEQKQRRAQAERLIHLITQVSRHGVVPGAGAALIACEPIVRRATEAQLDDDVRVGLMCLAHALSAPTHAIAENAGLNGAWAVQCTRAARRGWGIDVRTGRLVNLHKAGILDSAFALTMAVHIAASAAATFLSTDVIVHRRQTEAALRP